MLTTRRAPEASVLVRLTCPADIDNCTSALAIGGREDPSTPPAELEAIVAEIPDAELTVLDRARHLANVERADAFNETLLAYLDP